MRVSGAKIRQSPPSATATSLVFAKDDPAIQFELAKVETGRAGVVQDGGTFDRICRRFTCPLSILELKRIDTRVKKTVDFRWVRTQILDAVCIEDFRILQCRITRNRASGVNAR